MYYAQLKMLDPAGDETRLGIRGKNTFTSFVLNIGTVIINIMRLYSRVRDRSG